jgi:hypothetical protein
MGCLKDALLSLAKHANHVVRISSEKKNPRSQCDYWLIKLIDNYVSYIMTGEASTGGICVIICFSSRVQGCGATSQSNKTRKRLICISGCKPSGHINAVMDASSKGSHLAQSR